MAAAQRKPVAWLKRAITAAVAVPTVLGILTSSVGSCVLIHSFHFISLLEYAHGAKLLSRQEGEHVVAGGVLVAICGHYGVHSVGIVCYTVVVLLLLGHLGQLSYHGLEGPVTPANRCPQDILIALFLDILGILWVGLGYAHMVLLRFQEPSGLGLVLFALPVVWNTDNGALFAGAWAAKNNQDPLSVFVPQRAASALRNLSPTKSWTGVFGGLFLGTMTGWLLGFWVTQNPEPWKTSLGYLVAVRSDCGQLRYSASLFCAHLPDWGAAVWTGLGFILSFCAIAGDLFESAVKRAAGVKDSGRIFPGHGGALDRVDSLLFAIPAYFYACQLLLGA
mmetsp:Transcript_65678/g.148212  ORF Transcript_65678/g.148212 Transcript_65678/m.148212 type:complete len:335 (-) Transcript_65678:197-1201(-)